MSDWLRSFPHALLVIFGALAFCVALGYVAEAMPRTGNVILGAMVVGLMAEIVVLLVLSEW